MPPSRAEVLRLYKELLRYSDFLSFTDKTYYKTRIREEFQRSKNTDRNSTFLYEVKLYYKRKASFEQSEAPLPFLVHSIQSSSIIIKMKIQMLYSKALKTLKPFKIIVREKKTVDRTLVPKLNEGDLEEHFIKGSGPGGSRVNKSSNCVHLIHRPTGLQVKVHESRELHLNRKLARNKLVTMLDNLQNGENSIESQMKKLEKQDLKKKIQKQKKLSELKNNWRLRLTATKD